MTTASPPTRVASAAPAPPEETVSRWLTLSSFFGKGARYLVTYAGWRLTRSLAGRFGGAPAWPRRGAVERALLKVRAGAREIRGGPLREQALEHYRTRRHPQPLYCEASREALCASIPAAQREITIAHAERVVAREFHFRGEVATFPHDHVDWTHRPHGNIDWMRDLNRHHYFVTLGRAYAYTGDERFAEVFAELMLDWMEKNPPGVCEANWEGVFETSVRIANWCWAHALFVHSPTFDAETHLELLRGLTGMGKFLSRHLEVHSWNNHLLLEAKALAMLGRLYPELPGSAHWRRRGMKCLREQLRRQVVSDGVHSERSSHYHRLVTSELLEHVVVGRLAGAEEEDISDDLRALASFLAALTRVDGTLPMLGDSSRMDEHIRFDVLRCAAALFDDPALLGECLSTPGDLEEGTRWLLGGLGLDLKPPPTPGDSSRSSAFRVGGYWVCHSRTGERSLHSVFDCGPFSDPVVYGHGHADALSIDLTVGPHNFVLDPGMYSAYMGLDWRNYFRGTAAHNTVVVDGRDQTILRGAKRAYKQAPTEPKAWWSCELLDFVCGAHRGYERLSPSVVHERSVFFLKDRYWLVTDALSGEGQHRFDLLFHLLPGSEPTIDSSSGAVCLRRDDGFGLLIHPLTGDVPALLEGRTAPPQGWVAFQSGVKEPAPVVEYSRWTTAPTNFATLLIPLWPETTALPTVEIEAVSTTHLATRVSFADGRSDTLHLQLGALDASRTRDTIGEAHTDGFVSVVANGADGAVEFAALVGGANFAYPDLPALAASTRGSHVLVKGAWHEVR